MYIVYGASYSFGSMLSKKTRQKNGSSENNCLQDASKRNAIKAGV